GGPRGLDPAAEGRGRRRPVHARERRVRVRPRREGPDRRVRGVPEPAGVGRGERPRARRQGNNLDEAREREAVRIRSRPPHIPPRVL
ncbi:MAG: hypothetical protein AVDCRST_MAG80-218, partial [uncultured Rubrobacteraceae bacterium]